MHVLLNSFTLGDYLPAIDLQGAAGIHNVLKSEARRHLLAELSLYTLLPQELTYGKYAVRQNFSSVSAFPEGSLFLALQEEFQNALQAQLCLCEPYPLSYPFLLNECVVQQYEPGQNGISPHRDESRFINLIAVFVLEGRGRFRLYHDPEGDGVRPQPEGPGLFLRNRPGDLILMRAPGFRGSLRRPFHAVLHIRERRTSVAFRQEQ